MEFLLVKWLHILSAIILFGVGLGSAFYKWQIDRTYDVTAIVAVNRVVVFADWIFTTPAVLIQPVTGLIMINIAGHSMYESWLVLSLLLYFIAGICWLVVVYLQIKMKRLAVNAKSFTCVLSKHYFELQKAWFWLGVIAFSCMLVISFLMVTKPVLY